MKRRAVILIFFVLAATACSAMSSTPRNAGVEQDGVRKSGISSSPLPPDETNRMLVGG